MQFTKPYKQAIAQGHITTSFRKWKSPQAKVGGQYNIPPFGAIKVDRIALTTPAKASKAALKRAQHESREALCTLLNTEPDQPIYQVDFHFLGASPVKQIERSRVDNRELQHITSRLQKMDSQTAWTQTVLQLIADHPGMGARLLAPQCNMELAVFKRNVRKLKALGLTISLETGYRLSPRGEQLMQHLKS